jgi:hypothetical protein
LKEFPPSDSFLRWNFISLFWLITNGVRFSNGDTSPFESSLLFGVHIGAVLIAAGATCVRLFLRTFRQWKSLQQAEIETHHHVSQTFQNISTLVNVNAVELLDNNKPTRG